MKTFFTLLVAIASLSAYTLVGVHAKKTKCANCPSSLGGGGVISGHCVQNGAVKCVYEKGESTVHCYYNNKGGRNGGSDSACPKQADMGTNCVACD